MDACRVTVDVGAPADPLGDVYRMVRRLSRLDAPVPALLARDGADAVMLVERDVVSGWPPGSFGPHVLAPQDVARSTTGGHLLVLPWCVERVDAFLARRRAAGVPLTAGEAVTLLVSIARGRRAMAAAGGGAVEVGEWWLTDEGRPVFVRESPGAHINETRGGCVDASTDLLRHLAASIDPGARGLLGGVSLDAPASEADLFAEASPAPLQLHVGGTVRATQVSSLSLAREVVEPEPERHGRRLIDAVRGAVTRHVDADIAESLSDALHGARRRWITWRSARRESKTRVVITAGIAAAAVLAGGLLWPTGEEGPDAADPLSGMSPAGAVSESDHAVAESGVQSDENVDSHGGQPVPPVAPGESPSEENPSEAIVTEMSTLLDRRAGCVVAEASAPCLAEVIEDPTRNTIAPGAVDLPADQRRIELLDDLGGVAVLRVSASDDDATTVPQVAVIVQMKDRWVLREARDVETSP